MMRTRCLAFLIALLITSSVAADSGEEGDRDDASPVAGALNLPPPHSCLCPLQHPGYLIISHLLCRHDAWLKSMIGRHSNFVRNEYIISLCATHIALMSPWTQPTT